MIFGPVGGRTDRRFPMGRLVAKRRNESGSRLSWTRPRTSKHQTNQLRNPSLCIGDTGNIGIDPAPYRGKIFSSWEDWLCLPRECNGRWLGWQLFFQSMLKQLGHWFKHATFFKNYFFPSVPAWLPIHAHTMIWWHYDNFWTPKPSFGTLILAPIHARERCAATPPPMYVYGYPRHSRKTLPLHTAEA